MFVQGKVKTYNAERGFGFIAVEEGEVKDIFFHIKDVPNSTIEPKVGEKLKFIIVEDDGKFKADRIVRLDLQSVSAESIAAKPAGAKKKTASPRYNKASYKGRILSAIALIILALLAVIGYGQYQDYRTAEQLKAQQLIIEQQRIVSEQREALGDLPEAVLSEQGQRNLAGETYNTTKPRSEKINASIDQQNGVRLATAQFKCDERQHCSQMNSRAEAVWYVQNCPHHKMDGDGDGIPCENDSRW
ncbi:DNA-binding protein [Acinetobacter sp. ANC 4218]|uniref:cold shock domain-containing protein n=1 Tax=Acinetobacter sp. ANC 4218 TaxID=1977880 RepID=UPI000A336DEA|nr:cold shock domain-containing protein [Acinetobacter sp. ANC 4218]OTG72610.1 DNA-binding protein [Acinetobacter sp. ANC 4218]